MSQSSYVTLVESSAVQELTMEELGNQLTHYIEQLSRTGEQLAWDYAGVGFPFTIQFQKNDQGEWIELLGTNSLYSKIYLTIGQETRDQAAYRHIQILLPDNATHGDKAKANELCKYFAKTWLAELKLFNGRTMYFNPRK